MKVYLELDEMPLNCRDCQLSVHDQDACDYYCAGILDDIRIGEYVIDDGKYPDCPLKPVKEDKNK